MPCAKPPLRHGGGGRALLLLDVYWLYFDQGCVNFPVANAFEPGEPLLRGLDRPFKGARGSNDHRALAAAEELFVPGNFIDEAHAIARHLAPLPIRGRTTSCLRDRLALMIWINPREQHGRLNVA